MAIVAMPALLVGCGHTQKAAGKYAVDGYKLVWADEFNQNGFARQQQLGI